MESYNIFRKRGLTKIALAALLFATCSKEKNTKTPKIKSVLGQVYSGGFAELKGTNFGKDGRTTIRINDMVIPTKKATNTNIQFEIPYGVEGLIAIVKKGVIYRTNKKIQMNQAFPNIETPFIDLAKLETGQELVLEGSNFGSDFEKFEYSFVNEEGEEVSAQIQEVFDHAVTLEVPDMGTSVATSIVVKKDNEKIKLNTLPFAVDKLNYFSTDTATQDKFADNVALILDRNQVDSTTMKEIELFHKGKKIKNSALSTHKFLGRSKVAELDNDKWVIKYQDKYYPPIATSLVQKWSDLLAWQSTQIDGFYQSNKAEMLALKLKAGWRTTTARIDSVEKIIKINIPVESIQKTLTPEYKLSKFAKIVDAENIDWGNSAKIKIQAENGMTQTYVYEPKVVGQSRVTKLTYTLGDKKYSAAINHSTKKILLSAPILELHDELKVDYKLSVGARLVSTKLPLEKWRQPNQIEVISVNGQKSLYDFQVRPIGKNKIEEITLKGASGAKYKPVVISHSMNKIHFELPYKATAQGHLPKVDVKTSLESMYSELVWMKDSTGNLSSVMKVTSIDGRVREYDVTANVLNDVFTSFVAEGKMYEYPGKIDNEKNTIDIYVHQNEPLSGFEFNYTMSPNTKIVGENGPVETLAYAPTDNWFEPKQVKLVSELGRERVYTVTIKKDKAFHGDLNFDKPEPLDRFGKLGYTHITGDLTITGDEIKSLEPLVTLKKIDGNLKIQETMGLEDLEGLRLDSVTGNLEVVNNLDLRDLYGLSSVTYVGQKLHIGYNFELRDLSGLESLAEVKAGIQVRGNDNLVSLRGLENLKSLSGENRIAFNDQLRGLANLNQIKKVEGTLDFTYNENLVDLSGLESLSQITGDLRFSFNMLNDSTFSSLVSLTSVGENLFIHGNHGLTNVNGLENVRVKKGLSIRFNKNLVDLSAAKEIFSDASSLRITDNAVLKNLDPIEAALSEHKLERVDIKRNGLGNIVPPKKEAKIIETPAETTEVEATESVQPEISVEEAEMKAEVPADAVKTEAKEEVATPEVKESKVAEKTEIEKAVEEVANQIENTEKEITVQEAATAQPEASPESTTEVSTEVSTDQSSPESIQDAINQVEKELEQIETGK